MVPSGAIVSFISTARTNLLIRYKLAPAGKYVRVCTYELVYARKPLQTYAAPGCSLLLLLCIRRIPHEVGTGVNRGGRCIHDG